MHMHQRHLNCTPKEIQNSYYKQQQNAGKARAIIDGDKKHNLRVLTPKMDGRRPQESRDRDLRNFID